ncbi:hypothetical protein D3C79_35940 [compost metagenome]
MEKTAAESNQVTLHQDHHAVEKEMGDDHVAIGQWYWCESPEKQHNEDEHITKFVDGVHYCLLCVVHIGSNVVELSEPTGSRTSNLWDRILFSDVFEKLIFEPDHERVIQQYIDQKNQRTRQLLGQMSAKATELGISVSSDVSGYVTPGLLPKPTSDGTGIAVLSDVLDVEQYKLDIVEFNSVTLPALQNEVKRHCASLSKWALSVTLLPSAMIDTMQQDMKKITDRIEDVSIYAGIDEQILLVKDGTPASADEMIHVMQRRCYMDEECLLDYDAGGMSFSNISEFDKWLCRNGNMERLLPFPKSVVAFKVRRNEKSYENNLSSFIRIYLENQDKLTFMYIRNGDKLFRIASLVSFDEMIFPSNPELFNEPIMVKMSGKTVREIMTVREHDYVKSVMDDVGYAQAERTCGYDIVSDIRYNRYELFDADNLYFDEINQHFTDKIKKYNKICVILQGLLDRSDAFSPHRKISLSRPKDFMDSIKLIFDAENVLYAGEEPDFEAFQRQLNESIDSNSVFVGQYEAFIRRETDKENENRLMSRFSRELPELNRYVPVGNDGPGEVSLASRVMKSGKAIFTWERESVSGRKMIKDSITVPFDQLLNASAYRAGDYKRFYSDPRTREKYLKWAPFLLKAEDYATGKIQPEQPL